MIPNQGSTNLSSSIKERLADFALLVKFRLTVLVLFSAAFAYLATANTGFDWTTFGLLLAGGTLITFAANALNQVLEQDFDRLMKRTAIRPLVTGSMKPPTAVLLAGIMALGGMVCLTLINVTTGFLGTLSLISYAFVYTPLKRVSPLAVAVGAIPGALPIAIGVVAHSGVINELAIFLFIFQFLWQFPHFWAIAWVADEDYKRAGFNLLPSRNGELDENVGLLSGYFALFMVISCIIAGYLSTVSWVAAIGLAIISIWYAYKGYKLYRDCSLESAKKLMFASFIHLPLSLLIFAGG